MAPEREKEREREKKKKKKKKKKKADSMHFIDVGLWRKEFMSSCLASFRTEQT